MGLRINSNFASLIALNNLALQNQLIQQTAERISSGLRINRASDDPSGLVMAESLRVESRSLQQAIENAELVQNLIDSADGGLDEIGDSLTDIRDDILTALGDDTQTATLQDAVDSAIDAIERIASTTRFNGRGLLNGQSAVGRTGLDAEDLEVRRVFFGSADTMTVTAAVTAVASQATLGGLAASVVSNPGTNTVVSITGPLGTQNVTFFSVVGTVASFASIVNDFRDFTGVYVSSVDGAYYTEDFGSDERLTVTEIDGVYNGPTGTDTGEDIEGTIGGRRATGRGLSLSIGGRELSLEITFSSTTAAGVTDTFTLLDTAGLDFQLGPEPNASDVLSFAIESVLPGNLGRPQTTISGDAVFGFLESVRGGGANDLTNNPGNALRIVDEALDEVNSLRGFLGAINDNDVQSTIDSYTETVSNLADAESRIRDADIAFETAELTKYQILASAAASVLAQLGTLNGNLVGKLLGIDIA